MSEESKTVAQVMITTWANIPTSLSVTEVRDRLAETPGSLGVVAQGDYILAVIHADDVETWESTKLVDAYRDKFAPLLSVEATLPLDQFTKPLVARFLSFPDYQATSGILVEADGKIVGILPEAVLMEEAERSQQKAPLPIEGRGGVSLLAGTPPPSLRYWLCAPNEKHNKPVYTLMPGNYPIATPVCRVCGRPMQPEEE